MKVHLMSPDLDFNPTAPQPKHAADLAQDLQLGYLWDAMAGGDGFLKGVAVAATLQPLSDDATIRYRQEAFADSLRNRDIVQQLYGFAIEARQVNRGIFGMPLKGHPGMNLNRAVQSLTRLLTVVEKLRTECAAARPQFASPGFLGFFDTVARELDDAYMTELRERLRELSFPGGMLMSARLGVAGQVSGQVLRRSLSRNRRFLSTIALKRPIHAFTLPERDEAGHNLLEYLRDQSLNDVANAASQAVDHVLAFFDALRTELAFYLAELNLHDALTRLSAPTSAPTVAENLSARGLYDPCLALRTGSAPVGNDVTLDGEQLLVITGANHGGKSTFLRALGTAQLMLQAGLFVPADSFASAAAGMLFTHWAREEDIKLEHGKLDDELERMSTIVDAIRPGDLLLCNESFSSTNEAEGSELALEVTRALVQAGVRVRFVTHLYDFAHEIRLSGEPPAVFLRAPRDDFGERSYQLEPGEPLPTSFGVDLFDRRFGTHHELD